MPFLWWNNSYYLILIVQGICIFHAFKTGRRDYVYIILFVPVIGCAIYIIREILPEINRGDFWNNLQRIFFPGARIRDLERRLRISDTITNKMNLAEEYMLSKQYDKAITLTQSCIAQRPNDQGILLTLAKIQFHNGQFAESAANFHKVLSIKNRINNSVDELLYAQALEKSGEKERAEEEYNRIIRLHHSLEARYRLGLLLKEQQRQQEAKVHFQAAVDEIELHPRYVRRLHAQWARLSKRELSSL
ncbi:tetratricopeptide repeat protein [Chitinophaga niabensis]|uniref:tetratricopeptide repeat protein n=1 Tax=Chitinophaga niabensis TaxID=536979 RepID=UPI0031BB6359